MRRTLALALAALLPLADARWCQLEMVKSDPDGDFSFGGPWRLEGCTVLELAHGKCDEEDCPHRVPLVDEEVIELADALHGNSVINAIGLAANKVTDEAAKALAEALRDNEVLQELNLGSNQIGDEGAMALAEVWQTNRAFLTLNIEFNQIGDEGGKAILDVHKSNISSLEVVYMDNNDMSPWIYQEIRATNKLHQDLTPEELAEVEESRKGIDFSDWKIPKGTILPPKPVALSEGMPPELLDIKADGVISSDYPTDGSADPDRDL